MTGSGRTYRSILGSFGSAALERDTMTLMLKTLRSDETLDLRGLGVRFFAFGFGLDFTADDKFPDLYTTKD